MSETERETAPQRAYRPPTLGADVWYMQRAESGYGATPRAAKITQTYHQLGGDVHPTKVDVIVFGPNGIGVYLGVEFDPQRRAAGTWCWPQ